MKKPHTILALLLLLTTACDPQSLDGPAPAPEYGRISLSLSAHPEISITTRGDGSLTDEQLSSYEITLSGEKSWTKEYKDITPEDLIVPAGFYTITATNLSVAEAYPTATASGEVRVSGTEEVEVKTGQSRDCEIKCKPINAKVSFMYTAKFKQVFPNFSDVTVKQIVGNISRDITLTPSEKPSEEDTDTNTPEAALFEAEEISWEITLVEDKPNSTGTYTPEAGKWVVLTFDVTNTGELKNEITITASAVTKEDVSGTFNPYQ